MPAIIPLWINVMPQRHERSRPRNQERALRMQNTSSHRAITIDAELHMVRERVSATALAASRYYTLKQTKKAECGEKISPIDSKLKATQQTGYLSVFLLFTNESVQRSFVIGMIEGFGG